MVEIDTYFVRRDDQGRAVCATCAGFEAPATHVATYDKTDGSGRGAWSLCAGHAPFGLIAFGALTPLAEFEAAHDAVAALPASPIPRYDRAAGVNPDPQTQGQKLHE